MNYRSLSTTNFGMRTTITFKLEWKNDAEGIADSDANVDSRVGYNQN
jgi:hypothetical protein